MSEAAVILLKSVILIGILFGAAAYMTFCERVLMARMQMRIGPNRAGPLGLLQPIADGIKLLTKESFQPTGVEQFTYFLAPCICVFTALGAFVMIPFGESLRMAGYEITLRIADLNIGLLLSTALSSLAVYGVVLAGWSSNNRYSLLGGLRGTAQMISYEIPMGLALLSVVLSTGTLNLSQIVHAQEESWLIWTQPLSFLIYLITAFAETNRAPFDLPESEQELIGGYHTEYGGMRFALFFLAEYVNMLAVSALAVTLFLGGWKGPWDLPLVWFVLKVAALIFFFMWVRATMPRFRYDQLMGFGWKILIPMATLNLLLTAYFVLV
jgi:NADH-quinone oxidoreductase subunit H